MKRKNLILPFLALAFAVGMAFATTPINDFQPEVWMKENEQDAGCHLTVCTTDPGLPCSEVGIFYSDEDCTTIVTQVFARQN